MPKLEHAVLPLALALAWGCGEEQLAGAPVARGASAVRSVILRPVHGGTVIGAGPHPVEVVGRPGGRLEAYLLEEEAPFAASVQLTVRVATTAGRRPVVLVWDPRERRFRGVLRGPMLDAGPVEVVLVVDGTTHHGRAPSIVVADELRDDDDPDDITLVSKARRRL